MRLLSTIFFLFTIVNLYSQSPIGIGIVSVKFDDKTKIEFYKTSDLNEKIRIVEFFDDKSIKSWNIKNLEKQKDWLQPESLWLDYGQFLFRCKTNKSDCYEVYVSKNQTMWIKKQKFIEFDNWENYLQKMFSVERKDINTQKIYSSLTKDKIIQSKENCFKVLKMQGQWIHIQTAEHCEFENKINGWIRWRDENKILINYYTTS